MKRVIGVWIILAIPCLPAVFAGTMAVRSYTHTDSLLWSSPRLATPVGMAAYGRYAISSGGVLWIGFENARWSGNSLPAFNHTAACPPGVSFTSQDHPWMVRSYGFWGDRYTDMQPGYVNYERFVWVPWWAIFVSLIPIAAPTIFHFSRQRRRRIRAMNNQCANCGYDIRATPDRCPECGTLPLGLP